MPLIQFWSDLDKNPSLLNLIYLLMLYPGIHLHHLPIHLWLDLRRQTNSLTSGGSCAYRTNYVIYSRLFLTKLKCYDF